MEDMRFYVLFNIISVISGQWKVGNEKLCAMETPFTADKISPRAGIKLNPLDQ